MNLVDCPLPSIRTTACASATFFDPKNSAGGPDWNKHTVPTTASEPRRSVITSLAFTTQCAPAFVPQDRGIAATVFFQGAIVRPINIIFIIYEINAVVPPEPKY